MAPEKEGRGRRTASARQSKRAPAAEKATERAQGMPVVDVDPWGAFFEKFWEQVDEGAPAPQRGGKRK